MILDKNTSLAWLLLAVIFLSAGGYFVHRIARASVNNGKWDKLPESQKRVVGMTGVIASLLVGLPMVYTAAPPVTPTEFARTLSGILAAQIGGGWFASEVIKRWGKNDRG